MKERNRDTWIKTILFGLGVVSLLLPALWLGYPILHGDSGAYISSGFRHFAPVERPIAYGLFVWITSLGLSLWLVIIVQALMSTYVIDVFMRRVLMEKYLTVLSFFVVTILALTTGAAYFVCQIKADFLLPLILLAIYSILIENGKITLTDLLLGAVILFGLLAHHSHLPVTTGLYLATVLLVFLYRKFNPGINIRKYLLVFFIILAGWLIAPSVNYILTGSFTLSRVPYIFSTSRLIQAGAFQEYIYDRCRNDPDFKFCKYKDELPHYWRYNHFLWDEKSFLYDHPCRAKGKLGCWLERNEEFGILVKDIYSHKKYVKMLASDAADASVKQFFSFRIPNYCIFENQPYPKKMVQKYLPADNRFLEKARQSKSNLSFPVQNLIQLIIVIISVLYILYSIIGKNRKQLNMRIFLPGYMILLLLMGNAVFVGIFAGSSDRFQGRIIWLVPLYALILLIINLNRKIIPENK